MEFPFPGREAAHDEIKRDVMYEKLVRLGIDIDAVVDRAWDTGVAAAAALYKECGGVKDFHVIAEESGLPVKRENKDNVISGRRYFSEYLTNKKEMVLYTESIKKWAKANNLTYEESENVILAHEYFHHLENVKLGLTSKQCEVPMLTIFGKNIGKTGVRALSEVGAHAFARTYYELTRMIRRQTAPAEAVKKGGE